MVSQFIKFSLVGILNTAIHFGVFYFLYSFMGLYHLLASATGFCIAVTNSYFMNKYWTFNQGNSNIYSEFTRFLMVSLLSLLINLACMSILVDLFSIHPPTAQLAAIMITLVVNFLGNRYWTFNSSKKDIYMR